MDDQKFIENCFTTLYRLIKNDPANVNNAILEVFQQFIPHYPHKSFVLISNYYGKYVEDIHQHISDPYTMIGLLVSYFDCFIASDISYEFIKLLIYITLNDEIVTDMFINNGFLDAVVDSLSMKKIKDETLSCIYHLLLILSFQKSQKAEIEDTIIASHLKRDIVKKNVLNFLLVSKAKIGPKTVKELSNIKLHRSLYVLFQFALSNNDHMSLVESSDWLVNNFHQKNSVLQIFLALLADGKCRERLSRLPQTVTYLLDLVNERTDELLKLTSTCTRRLIFPDSLDIFQKNHFFKKYWEATKSCDHSVRGPCIMCIDKLVETGYIDDLNDILSDMTTIINSDDLKSAGQAIRIIAKASAYPECKHTLRKYKKYFNKLKGNADFKEELQMFQKNIQ